MSLLQSGDEDVQHTKSADAGDEQYEPVYSSHSDAGVVIPLIAIVWQLETYCQIFSLHGKPLVTKRRACEYLFNVLEFARSSYTMSAYATGHRLRILRYGGLLKNLVVKDLKVKYRNSFLGFLWSLLNPLMMIVVYSIALRYILRVQLDNFTLFLISGILPWNFFSAAMMASTEAVIGNANLIKKIDFPREILPLSTVLFYLVQLLLALLVFFPLMPLLGAKLTLALAAFPLVLLLHWTFAAGVALFLSAITVFYRDVKYLTEVGLLILFWMTPIVYDLSMVPEAARSIFRLNPLAAYITAYRDIFYRGHVPDLQMLIVGAVWAMGAVVIGSWVFSRRKSFFVEGL